MQNSKISKWSLIWPIIALAIIPIAVSLMVYNTPNRLPPGFGEFPPQYIACDPSIFPYHCPPAFWLPYFLAIAVVVLVILALYLVPKLFGFKGGQPNVPASPASFPWWFYLGGVVMVFFWWLMWKRPPSFAEVTPYAFTPMWWGFIVMLDGIVYKRNGGSSFMSSKPLLMLVCAVVSLFGWLFFEFFDYFVRESWYYPNMEVLPHALTVLVFLLAYTTVWPAVFEWYNLLNTFPGFAARYQNGPKVNVNGFYTLLAGFAVMAGMVIFPYILFWGVWIGPMLVLIGLLRMHKIASPIDGMAVGNWAPVLLIMLACILNGFIWEFWNYGSMHNPAEPVSNPNYWKYDIPFAYVIFLNSEMPLLGYFGYMPFGILVWQFYIWAGEVFGFNSDISANKPE